MTRDGFDISVIVPTFNRAASLRRLLLSLDSLALPSALRVELIVVNNGSTDGTEQMLAVEAGRARPFLFTVLKEQNRGKSSALNLGLRSCGGEIILVADDDVVVHPQWLKAHHEGYRGDTYAALQGRVLPGVDPEGKPADGSKLLEYNIPIVDYGDEIREVRGLTGTNMSFKREVVDKVGFFDVRLGPGAAGFSEDTEYSMRLRQAGFRIAYTPHAVVYHELDPARYGRVYNRKVQYRKGVSRSLYRRESLLLNVLPNLVANSIRFLLYRSFGMRQKAYRTEGRVLRYWGYLAGRLRGR